MTNSKLLLLNKLLNFLAAVGGIAATALASGQVPPRLTWVAGALAALGTMAAKYSKTPSPGIAAAVHAATPILPTEPK